MTEQAIRVFYSYSRKDLDMRNKLDAHLSVLKNSNKIRTWHDLQLEPGSEWEPTLINELNTAEIILLLISVNFLSSQYCYSNELKRAIARHNKGTARVIPIILSSCDWNQPHVPFSKLNVLPTHAKPIKSWANRDEAFTIVAQRIREIVDQLISRKLAKQRAEQQRQVALGKQGLIEELEVIGQSLKQSEKEIGDLRRRIEAQIERISNEIIQAERDYNLNRAAELKYGELANLQQELEILKLWETTRVWIDQTNIEILRAERNYDLNQAAELKYGKLIDLQRKFQVLEHWRTIKEQIDQINIDIAQAERDYDLNRAGELKDGELTSLQKQLEDIEAKLKQDKTL